MTLNAVEREAAAVNDDRVEAAGMLAARYGREIDRAAEEIKAWRYSARHRQKLNGEWAEPSDGPAILLAKRGRVDAALNRIEKTTKRIARLRSWIDENAIPGCRTLRETLLKLKDAERKAHERGKSAAEDAETTAETVEETFGSSPRRKPSGP